MPAFPSQMDRTPTGMSRRAGSIVAVEKTVSTQDLASVLPVRRRTRGLVEQFEGDAKLFAVEARRNLLVHFNVERMHGVVGILSPGKSGREREPEQSGQGSHSNNISKSAAVSSHHETNVQRQRNPRRRRLHHVVIARCAASAAMRRIRSDRQPLLRARLGSDLSCPRISRMTQPAIRCRSRGRTARSEQGRTCPRGSGSRQRSG